MRYRPDFDVIGEIILETFLAKEMSTIQIRNILFGRHFIIAYLTFEYFFLYVFAQLTNSPLVIKFRNIFLWEFFQFMFVKTVLSLKLYLFPDYFWIFKSEQMLLMLDVRLFTMFTQECFSFSSDILLRNIDGLKEVSLSFDRYMCALFGIVNNFYFIAHYIIFLYPSKKLIAEGISIN